LLYIYCLKEYKLDAHCFRFFAKQIDETHWEISGDEFYHLSKVLNLPKHNHIEVFDGQGHWAKGVISEMISKKLAIVKCSSIYTDPHPKNTFSIAFGALKQATVCELLTYLTELGTHEIHIFLHEGVPHKRQSDKTKTRYQKILLSSCKQCKRAKLPKLFFWNQLKDFILYSQSAFQTKIFLSKSGPSLTLQKNLNKNTCVVIGSEKGLNESENVQLIESNFEPASLGQKTLRSITAAISAATFVQQIQDVS